MSKKNSPISGLFHPQVSNKDDLDLEAEKPSSSLIPSDQEMENMAKAGRRVEGKLIKGLSKGK